MSTISLSPIPDFTASVSPPRVAGIGYPPGLTVGPTGDATRQMAVLQATLQALATIQTPGEVRHLPFKWPETLKNIDNHPQESPPIVQAIKQRPWLYRKLIAGDIPDK